MVKTKFASPPVCGSVDGRGFFLARMANVEKIGLPMSKACPPPL